MIKGIRSTLLCLLLNFICARADIAGGQVYTCVHAKATFDY